MQTEELERSPPKDDPFTPEELSKYDGTDRSKPILVAIKGECKSKIPLIYIFFFYKILSLNRFFLFSKKKQKQKQVLSST